MTARLEIRGLDKLEKKLGKLAAAKWKRAALKGAGMHIKRKVSPYPKYSPNKSRLWYERRMGTKWRRKDGSIGVRKSSERLSSKRYVKQTPNVAIIGNPVTYAPYVHGDERGREQARVHKKRGHNILIKVAEKELPVIAKKLSKQIDKILR